MVAVSISFQSQFVASFAALLNQAAMLAKASLLACSARSLTRQAGLRALGPVQLTVSPPEWTCS